MALCAPEGGKMKARVSVSVLLSLLLSAQLVRADEIAGLPLHVEELGEGAIRVWLGDHASTTTVFAFATEKGVVVVDTFGVPSVDAELRKTIARELGRSDFSYLINTHEHRDHTGGNSVYSDCTIVGHELIGPDLAQISAQRDRLLEFYPRNIAEMEREIQDLGEDAPEAAALRENLIYRRLFFEAVKANEDLVPPTLTFRDHMVLDLGDTTFELFYIGGMHTASDAAIFVPEHGLLLTGDTMADVWLTDRPGCLAAFIVRDGMPHDFPRWLANWDRLLAGKDRITTLMPSHWNGELSIEGAGARVEYVRTLWEGIGEAYGSGGNLAQIQEEYRLDVRFPELVDSPGFNQQQHYASVTELWKEITGQPSAARTLFRLIDEGADEAALQEILAEWNSDSPAYFFAEVEINAYGYTFLQQQRVDDAIRMFRINVELYPESWNVYDSLGEALLAAGQTSDAVTMYEKSIALNPQNEHGKEVLEGIRSSASM
jgi:glyoxylase-like metal-dependent hydrolase (beta-lactamase superfamily II)